MIAVNVTAPPKVFVNCRRLITDCIERLLFVLRLRLPLRRPVKRVDIIGIMLSKREHQMRILLGDGIHGVCRMRAATRH